MRLFFKAITTLFLIMIIGGIVLVFSFDPNHYKPEINQYVSNKIGRPFAIQGTLRWAFFPTLGFEAQDLSIAPPSRSNDAFLIQIQSAIIAIKLQPLLHRRIETDTLILKGVSLSIPKQANTKATTSFTAQEIRLRGSIMQDQAQGNITARYLVLNGLQIQSLSTPFTFAEKKVTLDPIHGQLYDGLLEGKASINLATTTPVFQVDENFSNIQIAPLFKDLKHTSRFQLDGKGTLALNLTAQGKTTADLRRTTSGNIDFQLSEGVLQGLDINYWLALGSAAYHREAVPDIKNTDATPFDSFHGHFNVQQGIARNDDLIVQTSLARATGEGQIDLTRETINYHLEIVKMNPETHQPHHDIVPLHISGPLSNPSIQLDLVAILKAAGKSELEHQVNKLEKKIGEQLKNIDVDKVLKAFDS